MKFVIGTKNKAKVSAVEGWANKYLDLGEFEVIGVDVESGIADQPMSNEESLEGAINRAKNALLMEESAEYGVGLEGGVYYLSDRMFLNGWVAIVDKAGNVGVGSSQSIELPVSIRKRIEAGEELGPIMHSLHDRDVRNLEGAFGILTNNQITRSFSFENALICAWHGLKDAGL